MRLRKAIAVIGRDVSQMLGRPIRDEHGEPLPALKSSEGDFYLMEFTRTGWQTLAGVHRVRLRRGQTPRQPHHVVPHPRAAAARRRESGSAHPAKY